MEIGSEEEIGWYCFDSMHSVYYNRSLKCLYNIFSSRHLYETPTVGFWMIGWENKWE